MAFVCEQYAPSSAANLLARIEARMVDAGWVLHDAVSATVRVYKSNGELGDRIYEYVWMSLSGSRISFRGYGWWNSTTHAGLMQTFGTQVGLVDYVAAEVRVIGGDKNLFYVYKRSLGDAIYFGHIPKRIDASPLATLSGPATAGSNVTLSVDNTTMFVTNKTYQLFDPAGAGRYPVKVTVIGVSSLTVETLPVNVATGSMIGAAPSTFICLANSSFTTPTNNQIGPTTAWNDSGTGTGSAGLSESPFIAVGSLDPNARLGSGAGTTGLYVLQPAFWSDGGSVAPIAYSDSNILHPPIGTGDTIFGDCSLSNGAPQDTGTVTSADATHLTISGKTWTPGGYVGKTVVIVSGTGAGQTRNISANTADTLTVNTWDVTPNATSIIYIFDAVYRVMSTMTGLAYRELI